jgi:AraC-like DNA-binding protein
MPTVSIWVVRALIDAGVQSGAGRGELLRAAGLDAEQLAATHARLPLSQVYRINEHVLDLTGDPALGLHWAERWTRSTFVPLSYLIAHATNLRQGFDSLAQFQRLACDQPGYAFVDQGEKVILRCLRLGNPAPRIERFSAEMVTASFFRILCSFNPGMRPDSVCFAYPAPSYHHEYTRLFEHAERFEQAFTGIVFDRALLSAASPHQDEDIHGAVETVAERRLACLTRSVPYALRVRDLLVQKGWSERLDMQSVARTLGLSVRSLRRRLAAEGKSYSGIENDAFAIVAKQLLREKQRTIQETAYDMGFLDTTTFHRAFKRATGTTPSKYRRAAGAGT